MKYFVVNEQPGKKPIVTEFKRKKNATEFYMDMLDQGENKTGEITVYEWKNGRWQWLWLSTPASISGRKKNK